ncbi:hypothetical protein AB0H37_00210 [Actinomadura sp. NPDC023710]|uniref:hypothetical protein n=1 Tax=Actinomadura sp. NPDC023710 TaxID=3158219 RepID=UPI0033D9F469
MAEVEGLDGQGAQRGGAHGGIVGFLREPDDLHVPGLGQAVAHVIGGHPAGRVGQFFSGLQILDLSGWCLGLPERV